MVDGSGEERDEYAVLHLITRFFRGGSEVTTVNTLDALAEAATDYDLRLGVGAFYDDDHLKEVESTGVETTVFRSIRHYNPFAAVVAVFAVAWYLHREEIDIVHTHSTEAGVIGRFAAALAGTPVVVHEIHGDPVTEDRSRLLNTFVRWMERISTKVADTVVVKSDHIRQTYLDRGIGTPEQYELIYHGVDIENHRAATPERESDRPVFIFAGRLTEGKGILDLFDAVTDLAETHDFELLLAGDGDLEETLERAVADRGLSDRVHLLGYRDDLSELLAASDVLVLPSYREGTPRVITEAKATGVPSISTRIAGIPEQVADGETGFLIEPGDVDALRDRMATMIEEPERRERMGEAASEAVAEFDIDTAQPQFRALYDRLVERHL